MQVITQGTRVNESGAFSPALIVLPPSEVTVVQSVVAVDIHQVARQSSGRREVPHVDVGTRRQKRAVVSAAKDDGNDVHFEPSPHLLGDVICTDATGSEDEYIQVSNVD